ncbi:MAG: sigma-70 family RNA polymerase sigma factor [Planctomycetia bacterium]|nr:sigma-70 family RNA polymerase sigma factor [Planctomycetia bacterium]
MVSGRTSSLGKQLRRIVIAADAVGLSDADLLDSFVTGGEEAAFEALVRRHGPMVMGVCRRVLHDPHEADDAFQATFVVLLRKCQSLAQPELLGNWLYGVAFRTAREVRNRAARRRARELQAPPAEAAAPASEWDDVRPVLDEELNKLPTKYRLPVVLCDLQSKSRKEVARQIGCPEGTLSSRLARAHDLLRRRLLRRGLVLSAGGLAVGLSAEVASAALLPPTLVVNTVKAALAVAVADAVGVGALSAPVAALVEGVMQTMFLAKVKVTAAVLLTVGLVGTSIGMLTHRALADRPGAAAAEREQPTGPRVQGIVKSVDAERNSVTVTVRHEDGKPADHTVAVPKDAKIVLMKGAGALSDLRPQMAVRVQLSADEKSVVAIQELARGEEAGRDGQPGRDGVGRPGEPGRAGRDGQPGRDGVGRPGEPGRAGREEERPNLVGQVKAVDADQRTITITIRRDGQQPEDQTLAVAANASVVVPTKEAARLGDVQVGMRVALSLEAGKQLVTGVRADGGPRVEARRTPSMPAVFQAADGKANTITVTIQGDGGRNIERTFELSKEIRVSTGKKEDAQLSDLAAGMRITLLMSPDRRTIIGVKELVGEGDKPVERRPDGEKPADRKPDGDKPGDRKPERE